MSIWPRRSASLPRPVCATKQLEASGVIRGYVALLNRKMLGFGVEAFVQVSLDRHPGPP